ncbi:hypothetical protein BCV70DRAFT_94358 [Testicularia cyperi]|uniref:Uncharacterized protein n=1 Tax=Testicularia cyperi TaxID=1882483 RepID=A0A317XR51_9BASI|nr:hypothetical protein BCV70DRAFT_94358 [Testicularia cyperi]
MRLSSYGRTMRWYCLLQRAGAFVSVIDHDLSLMFYRCRVQCRAIVKFETTAYSSLIGPRAESATVYCNLQLHVSAAMFFLLLFLVLLFSRAHSSFIFCARDFRAYGFLSRFAGEFTLLTVLLLILLLYILCRLSFRSQTPCPNDFAPLPSAFDATVVCPIGRR